MSFVINQDLSFVGGEKVIIQTDRIPWGSGNPPWMELEINGVHPATPEDLLATLSDMVDDSELWSFTPWVGGAWGEPHPAGGEHFTYEESREIINESIRWIGLNEPLDSRWARLTSIADPQKDGWPTALHIRSTEYEVEVPHKMAPWMDDFRGEVMLAIPYMPVGMSVGRSFDGGPSGSHPLSIDYRATSAEDFVHWIRVLYWFLYTYIQDQRHGSSLEIDTVWIQTPLKQYKRAPQDNLLVNIELATVRRASK